MSKAAEKVKENMSRYINTMHDLGKKPSAVYVTKDQFEILRAEAKEKPDFKPRFQGYEVVVHG